MAGVSTLRRVGSRSTFARRRWRATRQVGAGANGLAEDRFGEDGGVGAVAPPRGGGNGVAGDDLAKILVDEEQLE